MIRTTTGGKSITITIWRVENGIQQIALIDVGKDKATLGLAISDDDKALAYGVLTFEYRVWDIAKNKEMSRTEDANHHVFTTLRFRGESVMAGGLLGRKFSIFHVANIKE